MVTATDRERYEKAAALLDSGKPAQAYEIYDQLAREGDPHCQVFVGWMHYSGHGISKNEATGLEWFSKAAALGSAPGAFYCGRHAARARNWPEALRYFRDAAGKEYSPALLWLGLAHTRGYGVQVDLAKGLPYLNRSANLGNFFAKRELALLMVKGKLGMANVAVGLLLLPYYVAAALIDRFAKGHSERFMG